MGVSGKGYSMEDAMRSKIVKVGIAAAAAALASSAFAGVAFARGGGGEVVNIGGDGGAGGAASTKCGVALALPIGLLGVPGEVPGQCQANGGAGGIGGPVFDH
jgi:hypothetical protein